MNNDNTTYKAQTIEAAQRFLLMPCYASAFGVRWLVIFFFNGMREKSNKNPSIQCSVCGQWKRLHGKDENGKAIQRFYACCEQDGKIIEHEPPVCDDCCKEGKCCH